MNIIQSSLLKEKDHRILDFLFFWKRPIRPGDLKKEVDLKHSTLNSILKRLMKNKLITWEKYGLVSLTENGLKYASHISNHHFVIEKYLIDTLEISNLVAHQEAIHLAGAFSCDLIQKICSKYNLSHENLNHNCCMMHMSNI